MVSPKDTLRGLSILELYMILARSALRDALASGDLKVLDDLGDVFPGFRVGSRGGRFTLDNPRVLEPASIDLHLGSHWLLPIPNTHKADGGLKYDSRIPVGYHEHHADEWEIPGHGFALARTQEVVELSGALTAWVTGRSSFGRFGVNVENAAYIDPGFHGSITLELYNSLPHPVVLYAGTPCCQLVVASVLGDVEGGYQGSYQGQLGTRGSMLYRTVPGGHRDV